MLGRRHRKGPLGQDHGDLELAAAERSGPSGQGQGTVAETRASRPGPGPGRLAAGSYATGLQIGNPARRRVLIPPGQKRAGVSCKLVSRVWA